MREKDAYAYDPFANLEMQRFLDSPRLLSTSFGNL